MVLGFYVQQFAEDSGEDEHSQWVTAEGHFRVAKVRAFLGQGEEAEKSFRTAVRLYEKLAGDSSDVSMVQVYRRELAISQAGLGNLLVRLGRHAEAEAAYRQALALQEKLAGDYPSRPQFRVDLADSYVNFGNFLRDRGQLQAALDRYGKAISLLQPIPAQDDQFPTAHRFLRDAHWNRALTLGQLGRYAESAKDWLRASELDIGRMRPYFRLQHSLALAHIGEHRVAVKAVEELLSFSAQGASAPSGPLLYDSACVYSLSAAAVKGDAQLREQYAVRAVALLRQAQHAEFFKDPKQIENMRKDTDLDALRQREDFKKLLAEFK
jgi:tetratricopeptide (TPR) repeat protein